MSKSPLYCEHANEMPNECLCKNDCYCKEHSCKSKDFEKIVLCPNTCFVGDGGGGSKSATQLCRRAIYNFFERYGYFPELIKMSPIVFEMAMDEWWEIEVSTIGSKMIKIGGKGHKKFDAINKTRITGKGFKIRGIPTERI